MGGDKQQIDMLVDRVISDVVRETVTEFRAKTNRENLFHFVYAYLVSAPWCIATPDGEIRNVGPNWLPCIQGDPLGSVAIAVHGAFEERTQDGHNLQHWTGAGIGMVEIEPVTITADEVEENKIGEVIVRVILVRRDAPRARALMQGLADYLRKKVGTEDERDGTAEREYRQGKSPFRIGGGRSNGRIERTKYGPRPGTLENVAKAVRAWVGERSWEDARKAGYGIDHKTINAHLEAALTEQFQEPERSKAIGLLQGTNKNQYLGRFRKK